MMTGSLDLFTPVPWQFQAINKNLMGLIGVPRYSYAPFADVHQGELDIHLDVYFARKILYYSQKRVVTISDSFKEWIDHNTVHKGPKYRENGYLDVYMLKGQVAITYRYQRILGYRTLKLVSERVAKNWLKEANK